VARALRIPYLMLPVSLSVLPMTASAADCYIDSDGGNDSNSGLEESQPVESQAAIPASCTVARYKRGSVFAEPVRVSNGITTYTNYGDPSAPLPRFSVPRSPNNGSMFQSFTGGVTIDGLSLSGSMSDSSMSNLMNGVCVFIGGNSQLINSEITNCDIGVMLFGEGSLVQNNYIHDLYVSVDAAPGVDPNQVGGAEGIFINGSNNEVSYNSFVRCSSTAEWTGGSCDGGATEVAVGAGETVSGVRVHHNFAFQSCGFFEVSSMAGDSKGRFTDSEFSYNVAVDSGWLMLLQVNNTDLSNIRWDNNTIVHRKSTAINPGMLVTVFNGTSSGVSGGALLPDTVFLRNDLFVLDGFGATDYIAPLDSALVLENTLVLQSPATNPGLVNISGSSPEDFDLVAGSPAIDQGVTIPGQTLDFLNRVVPDANGVTDVGAFEYAATPSASAGGALNFGGSGPAPEAPATAGTAADTEAEGDDAGCGCRIPSGSRANPLWLVLGLVALGTARFTRRPRQARRGSL